MKKVLLFIVSIFLLVPVILVAQDKIYKKGGEVLDVKILEVSPDEIKYKLFNDTESPIFIIDKDRLLKVIYQNGREETYQSTLNDSELYIGQKRNIVKINFLSPLLGYTQLAYEHNIKPGRSFEASVGIIGLGKKQELDNWSFGPSRGYLEQRGVFASFGYKFIKQPDFRYRNEKYTHILQGSYIKPEIMLGSFSQNNYHQQQINREKITFGGILINVGKQWVFSEVFVLDIYAGAGYSFNNEKEHTYTYNNNGIVVETTYDDFSGRHYGMLSTGRGSSIGFSGGLRVGYIFK